MTQKLQSIGRQRDNPRARLLAWSAHAYTASGLVAAAGMAVCIVRGDPVSFRWAFVFMLIATIIDATDGWFARWARVRDLVPSFDGRRLDDIIDFLTYTSLPLLLVWRAGVLPSQLSGWLLVPLLASAYGFSQTDAKSDDGYFLGFPSYWNLVAFYLYVLRPPAWLSLGLMFSLALLTFLPTPYLYPTQPGWLNQITTWLGVAWVWLPLWVLFRISPYDPVPDERYRATTWWLAIGSLWYPIYYLLCSWLIGLRIWLQRGEQRVEAKESGA